ncbi:hypothetical protein P8452_33526 [Trifolium repens]|nr:Carbohydrate-binding X8 domain superfamily protein [Trifolium repens]WJX46759.1 hypothetical protein P8452_33526 [Trifolium repens]
MMTKSIGSILIFFFLYLNAGGHLKFANGTATWCVAKFSASEVELNENIEYACNMLGDCKIIQAGGSCFYPNTTLNHASVVMNQYYAKNGRNDWDCYFRGSALIVVNDPSYGNCKYA